jgi:hypothetical protein
VRAEAVVTFLSVLAPHQRDGFNAGAGRRPASDNPWRAGTLGHLAWSFGWSLGRALCRRGGK